MSNLNIITVIAIILFARLGVRLVIKYRELSKNGESEGEGEDVDKDEDNKPS